MILPKWSRFHFVDEDETTTIQSNEILMKDSQIKFEGKFYTVSSTYVELLSDGNIIQHHQCTSDK